MSLKRIASEVDEIANELEKRGLQRFAAELDAVSNTLEKEESDGPGPAKAPDVLNKLRAKWRSEPDIHISETGGGGVSITCDCPSPEDLPDVPGKDDSDWEKGPDGFKLRLSAEEAQAAVDGGDMEEDNSDVGETLPPRKKPPMAGRRKAGGRTALDMNSLVDRSGTGGENPGSEAAHEWERYDSYDAYASGKTNKTPMGPRSVLNLVLTGRGEAPSPADLLSRLDFAQDDSHPEEGHKIMVTANESKRRKGGRRRALNMAMGEATPMSPNDSELQQDLPDDHDWLSTAGMQGRMPALDDNRHKTKFRHTPDETEPRSPDGNNPHSHKPQEMGGMPPMGDMPPMGGPPMGLAASARQARKILREAAMKAIAMEPDDLGRKDPETGESLDIADRHPYIGAGDWESVGAGPAVEMGGGLNPGQMPPEAMDMDSPDAFQVPLPDDDETSDMGAGLEYAAHDREEDEDEDYAPKKKRGGDDDDDLSDLLDQDEDEEDQEDEEGEPEEEEDEDENEEDDGEEWSPADNLKGKKKGEVSYASRRRRS